MECHVCCEHRGKIIHCDGCELKACKECSERYLLESSEDPHCMGCRTGWNRVFLMKNFPKAFVTGQLKNHREDVLLDREKSLLPTSQGYVDRYLHEKEVEKAKKLVREEIKRLEAKIDQVFDVMSETDRVWRSDGIEAYEKYTRKMKEMRYDLTEYRRLRQVQMDALRDIRISMGREVSIGDAKSSTKCPLEGCRGYLNGSSVCGVCEKKVCRNCMEELVDKHVCDPDTVETLKAIKKESRACPGCGTMVSRIDGCDQMWCTMPSCHTAFSWRTGKPVTGHIHNPHYIQFQNQNGRGERDIQDVPCGGIPNYRQIATALIGLRMLRKHRGNYSNVSDHMIGGVYMATNHVLHVDMPRFHVAPVDNGMLRAKYLLKEIHESDLKKTLQMQEKKRDKMKAFVDVLAMFTHTMSDIFRNIIHVYNVYREQWCAAYDRRGEEGFDYDETYNNIVAESQKKAMNEFKTIERLAEYTIEHLDKISTVYQCVVPNSSIYLFQYSNDGFVRRYQKTFRMTTMIEKAFIGIANESRYTLIHGSDM